MVESPNGVEGMQQGPENDLLKNVAENMTSNGLSLRARGIDITLIPDEYLAEPPRKTPAEEKRQLALQTARVLQPREFVLGFRGSQANIQEGSHGSLHHKRPLTIQIANLQTSIGLVDPSGLGFLTANLRQEILAKAPKERKADIEGRWTEFVNTIEERLNRGIDPKRLSALALAQLKEHRKSIEMFKGWKEHEIADPSSDKDHKEYAERLRQQYVAELSKTDILIRAFESGDQRAKAKFGITGHGYGDYTVQLIMNFQQPSPWGNAPDEEAVKSTMIETPIGDGSLKEEQRGIPPAVREALSQLQGATFDETESAGGVITIIVKDLETWRTSIEQLKPFVWDLVRDAYGKPSDDEDPAIIRNQLAYSFNDIKRLHLKFDGDRVIGYSAEQPLAEDPTVAIVADINVDASERRRGLGEQLYAPIFEWKAYDAVIGASINPDALKLRSRIAQKSGYTTLFAPSGTIDERIEDLKRKNLADLHGKGVLMEEQLPPGHEGCVLVKPDYLPPVSEADLQKLEGHEFYPAVKRIFELQKQYGLGSDARATVLGHFFSLAP